MVADMQGKEKDVNCKQIFIREQQLCCLKNGKIFKEIIAVVNELKDKKKAAYKTDVYNYLCKERSILLSEAVFDNDVTKLTANGKITKRKYAKKETLNLPSVRSNSTADSSNNDITQDKQTQLCEGVAGIKSEFLTPKNFVIAESRDMKSFNKSNFEPVISNSLFDPNEGLIVVTMRKSNF